MKKILTLIAFCFIGHYAFAQVDFTLGLKAYYPFTGNANDLSGNNNNGTVYGCVLTTGKLGLPNTAYYFNGTSDYIEVANSPSLSPTLLTMCAVVKPEGFYTGTCQSNVIFWKGNNFLTGHYGLTFSDQVFDNGNCTSLDTLHETFYGEISSNSGSSIYTPYIARNIWYCIICTYDGDSTKMYIDGNLKYSVSTPSPIGVSTSPLDIGHDIYDALFPYWFHGVMDEIRIYDRVFNNEEINSYCNLSTSINDEKILTSVKISDVSASGTFGLHFEESFNSVVVHVYNSIGQAIVSKQMQQVIAGTEQRVDISNLAQGIYFLDIIADKKHVFKKLRK